MNPYRALGYLKVVLLALSLAVVLAVPSRYAMGEEKTHPVPKASCGPQDRTESVQGETTMAERFAPGPSKAYNCNLELIGQFEGEGSGYDLNVFDNCAYYSVGIFQLKKIEHPGTPVLDVADSRHPQVTMYLNSPAMLAPNESLEVNEARKLLLATAIGGPTNGMAWDIYDISDCRHPVLKSTSIIPRMTSHSGSFVPDGRTFYGASSANPIGPNNPPKSAIFAVDTSDPSQPYGIATWIPENPDWITHSVSVNQDGTRAYVALNRGGNDWLKLPNPNGLVILDVSDIQARKSNPQFRVISTLFWDDTHFAQFGRPVTIKGKPYLIWTDLAGAIGTTSTPPADACDSGKPGHGFARFIDISDEKNPKTVSKLMLEVADPANCKKVMNDPRAGLGLGAEGCTFNNDQDPKMMACGYYEGGLRVFDIRDLTHPKEIAYYKPPARRTEVRLGSGAVTFLSTGPQTGAAKDHTADAVIVPKFRKNGEEIWFNSFDNGFQVVSFSDRFRAREKELFQN